MKIFNLNSTRAKRKLLRQSLTEAERSLWEKLRNKRFQRLKFFRQYGIGHYVADFYCPRIQLAIEIDGRHHLEEDMIEYDKERDKFLGAHGIRTIRFTNEDVLKKIDSVLDRIQHDTIQAPPSLSKRGNGGV